MSILATVITPGYVSNALVYWLNEQPVSFTLIEAKPRERSKMEALRTFLANGSDWWLMLNHYANPQFGIADVPFDDHSVITASMMRNNGGNAELIDVLCPTGCLFMRRDVAESIADVRPFEYIHDTHGNCVQSGDSTLTETLAEHGIPWHRMEHRCLNRQEAWI